jgi:hypothetical protein
LTADGNAACYNAHALIGGGTQSNVVAGALSTTTLDTGIQLMRTMKDQAGVVLGCVPSILLVPPALFTLAIRITESALLQGTGNNDINVYKSAYGIQVMQTPYLSAAAGGTDTDWFLLSPNHSVTRVIRQDIETALRPWQMSNNRTYLYQANFREVVFISDYSGLVGGGTTRS